MLYETEEENNYFRLRWVGSIDPNRLLQAAVSVRPLTARRSSIRSSLRLPMKRQNERQQISNVMDYVEPISVNTFRDK